MKQSTKAVLLSALVLPGLGHMLLKQYRRGVPLMLAALAAVSVYLAVAIQSALGIMDRINSGEVALDEAAISSLVSDSVSSSDSTLMNISVTVLVVCWLIGIIDSYRLGLARDKRETD
jgi:hypothetical protein